MNVVDQKEKEGKKGDNGRPQVSSSTRESIMLG